MNAISNFLNDEAGQTATEYMLILSVVVIAIVAGAYEFSPTFQTGTQGLAQDVAQIATTGMIGDIGTKR